MPDPNPLALARDLCSRATPYRLLKRVAGLAFNFSSVSVAPEPPKTEEPAGEPQRPSGMRPAFRT
jgi:hypothetical protein